MSVVFSWGLYAVVWGSANLRAKYKYLIDKIEPRSENKKCIGGSVMAARLEEFI